jgi:hypothetical protein
MITIAVTPEAFAAIVTFLPEGYKAERRPDGAVILVVAQQPTADSCH